MSAHQIVSMSIPAASRRVVCRDSNQEPLPKDEAGLRRALIDAGLGRDHDRIDAITAALAKLGRCRPSGDMSMLTQERARLLPAGKILGHSKTALTSGEAKILTDLQSNGPASSEQIAERVGMVFDYVKSIAGRLLNGGYIRVSGVGLSSSNRRVRIYTAGAA